MRHGLSPTEGLIVSLVEPYSMPEVLPAHYIISKYIVGSYFKTHIRSLFHKSPNNWFLDPGTVTNMALTTTYFKRQPGPWTSNCTSKYPPSKGALAIGENITYSLSVCKNLCILNYIFEECNCIDPLLIEASSADFDDFEGLAFCSLIPANADRICAGNATINFGKSSNCHCQPACDALSIPRVCSANYICKV